MADWREMIDQARKRQKEMFALRRKIELIEMQQADGRPGMPWVFDDGGRKEAGYKGQAGDCVCRAIAIATERQYQEVYDEINKAALAERPRRGNSRSSAREGVMKPTIRSYMESIGWVWVPTMQIGSGTKVHLKEGELPKGRLVVSVSKHCVAVIDGVIHDTGDVSRNGTRCVYGYYYDGKREERLAGENFEGQRKALI